MILFTNYNLKLKYTNIVNATDAVNNYTDYFFVHYQTGNVFCYFMSQCV